VKNPLNLLQGDYWGLKQKINIMKTKVTKKVVVEKSKGMKNDKMAMMKEKMMMAKKKK